ncbi:MULTISPECIES: NAD(P)/FAD-dependent oxidoreductase [unclassified Agarivorans]|uniref:NAD(P)/FAD-dependent oxidoreductase n=1 Tax=unclassified Agarivorans TaxID=2636026 RepID=UPI0026E185AF|nr:MULTISPECIES: NAD(P)/FAD-dependent oxidoreductase [unclassified Agarivorans]MDO6686382.1 NAD(P)/FAD-dependent oxidoreductase [Agarivorans sp. 3_MG-2023]MDO6713684.1 NAD(P)/FAD-dependent oxidoreductase [Agarivorans sp. 2_MG-2023]
MTRIVVVGGGAGGLELATRLGRKLGKHGKANVVLVDKNRTHLWKPLLHEVATGSLDAGIDALSYRSHAANHGFEFQLGEVADVNREDQLVTLKAMVEEGKEVLPARQLNYDYLIMAIGSVSNDFNTKGVKDNCIFLDNPSRADLFHRRMLNRFLQYSQNDEAQKGEKVRVAIVGAGATGVELSAELHNALDQLRAYGVPNLSHSSLAVTLVEAGEKILPALPVRISSSAHSELQKMGVDVRTKTMVTEATEEGLTTKDGELIKADLMVWAAGIKCPDFMKELGGLETNRINQLVVRPTLQTSRDSNIYAIGDCASCAMGETSFVPPRAQSAHQMATLVFKNIVRQIEEKPLQEFEYKDHGSLVSLSRYSTVGSLMGNLMQGSMMIEGRIARVMYISLYRMHQIALHGYMKTGLMMLVGRINQVLRPKLKLH